MDLNKFKPMNLGEFKAKFGSKERTIGYYSMPFFSVERENGQLTLFIVFYSICPIVPKKNDFEYRKIRFDKNQVGIIRNSLSNLIKSTKVSLKKRMERSIYNIDK